MIGDKSNSAATFGSAAEIKGYASDPNFAKWQLDLLPSGDANAAIFLALGTSPGEFSVKEDTAGFPNGEHALRLRVVRQDANYDEYFTKFVIANPAPKAAAPASTAVVTPAASPAAGDRVVFASDRTGNYELYIADVPAPGAARTGPFPAKQLTSDGKSSSLPVVSPDGRWIAYILEVANPDKTPKQRDIWLISPDGQKRFNLTQNSALNYEPTWSPDSSQIAFISTRVGNGYEHSIWVQHVAPILAGEGPAPRQIVDIAQGPDSPVWSPDGQKIAYLGRKDNAQLAQMYTVKPDGTGRIQLTAHSSEGNGSGMSVPAWQPDGRWMLVPMSFGPKLELVLLPVDGTTSPIPDTDLRVVTNEGYADWPAWEADARWVALHVASSDNYAIALMDMQSGEVRRIAPQLPGLAPLWSGDGSRLVFGAVPPTPGVKQDIFVTNRDGSNPLNVTANPANEFGPAWLPPNHRQP